MFCRYLSLAIFPVAVVLGGQLYTGVRNVGCGTIAERDLVSEESNRETSLWLEDLRSRRNAFAKFATEISDDLASGDVKLIAAVDRMFYYCLQNYPEHLESVSFIAPGRDIKAKLGHNLVWGVRTILGEQPERPQDAELIARLERELHELDGGAGAWH